MLRKISNECKARSPEKVKTDLEAAIFQAVIKILTQQIEMNGCFYHLTQSI